MVKFGQGKACMTYGQNSLLKYSEFMQIQVYTSASHLNFSVYISGVVHEHPRLGSDGESEEGSGTSDDVGVSPCEATTENGQVKMRQKTTRKLSNQEEINKRLSLPADLRLPDNFVETISPTLEGPLTRACRRQSLSEIGFGRKDTYTKLDKIGEVSEDVLQNAIYGSPVHRDLCDQGTWEINI